MTSFPADRGPDRLERTVEEGDIPPAPPMPPASGRPTAETSSSMRQGDTPARAITSPPDVRDAPSAEPGVTGAASTSSAAGVVGLRGSEPSATSAAHTNQGLGTTSSDAVDADAAPNAVSRLHLDERQAREALMAWAHRQLLVDESMFTGELRVENRPLLSCILTRVLETREEKQIAIPAHQPLPNHERYTVGLDAVTVPQTTDFQNRSWRLILAKSEREVRCPAACMNGRQQCKRCEGGQVRCSFCSGSGQHRRTHYDGTQSIERVEHCSSCGGSGRRPCSTCRGSGWVRCKTCQGAGALIQFVQGEIDHTATPVEFSEPLPTDIKQKKLTPNEWALLNRTPGQSIPELVPIPLRDQVEQEMERRPANELLRKLEVQGLPRSVIAMPDQPNANIQIVGSSQIIIATGVKSRKRVQWLTAAIVGILVMIVAVIVVTQLT